MKELTKAEEQIMQVIWKLRTCFIRDIIEKLPTPKPAYNTVGTFLKILERKNFVSRQKIGNIFSYSPAVTKKDYSRNTLNSVVSKYFSGSPESLLSFMAEEKSLTIRQIENLLKKLKKND